MASKKIIPKAGKVAKNVIVGGLMLLSVIQPETIAATGPLLAAILSKKGK